MDTFKRSFVTLVLVCVMLISGVFPTYASTDLDIAAININASALISSQAVGDVAFHNLNKILVSDLAIKSPKYTGIIANYAGSSIDKNGKLIVYMAGDSSRSSKITDLKEDLKSAGTQADAVQFVQVEYTYDELKAYQNVMWAIRNQAIADESNPDIGIWADKISSVAINPINNRVTVLASNFTIQDYAYCDALFGDYPYEIDATVLESECVEEITSLHPGQGISTGGSIGYRCMIDGVEGFVTTIHTNTFTAGQAVRVDGVKVGEIVHSVYDGVADFTFVKLTNTNYEVDWNTNTTMPLTLHNNHYVISLPIGYTVYMVGCNSSNIRSGKVVYYDYAIASGTSWLIADYESSGGDSGGCVFAGVNGDYCVIGIHNGSINVDSDAQTEKYITKHSIMKNYFNITIY